MAGPGREWGYSETDIEDALVHIERILPVHPGFFGAIRFQFIVIIQMMRSTDFPLAFGVIFGS